MEILLPLVVKNRNCKYCSQRYIDAGILLPSVRSIITLGLGETVDRITNVRIVSVVGFMVNWASLEILCGHQGFVLMQIIGKENARCKCVQCVSATWNI